MTTKTEKREASKNAKSMLIANDRINEMADELDKYKYGFILLSFYTFFDTKRKNKIEYKIFTNNDIVKECGLSLTTVRRLAKREATTEEIVSSDKLVEDILEGTYLTPKVRKELESTSISETILDYFLLLAKLEKRRQSKR